MASIHDASTDKLPAPASLHEEATKQMLRIPKQSPVVLPGQGRYDEERILRSVRLEEQGFSWIPVVIFALALVFYGCMAIYGVLIVLSVLHR